MQGLEGAGRQIPPKLIWNPWIELQSSGQVPPFRKSPATKFTSDEDVSKFLENHPDSDSASPFAHNQTVRLIGHKNDIKKTAKLIKILDVHRRHIKQVIYQPAFWASKSLTLPRFLSRTGNISTLIIDMSHEELEVNHGEEFPRQLNNLRELVIGFRPNQSINRYFRKKINKEPVCSRLALSYGPQIRFLTLNNASLERVKQVLEIYPNLEALKLENLSDFLTFIPGGSCPKLRRLALGSEQCKEGLKGFKNVLRLIQCFSGSLELLSLGVKHAQLSQSSLKSDDNQVESGTVFTQYKELILPIVFVSLGRNKDKSLESRFGFQFPDLKRLVLQDSRGEFKNKDLNAGRVKKICERIWDLFPPSVETINLRTEKWGKHLERHFPVVYKCSRSVIE